MIYQWREGARFRADAQAAGERLEEIRGRNSGDLTPADVVEDARDEGSPLHPDFEWDDAAAARAHREELARKIIRSIRVVPEEAGADEEEARPRIAYVSVGKSTRGGSRYVTTARAMSDGEMRARVLRDAIGGLESWRYRYGHLKELADVIRAIDDLQIVEV